MSNPTKFVRDLVEDKCDPKLGESVRAHLAGLGLETSTGVYDPESAFLSLESGIREAYESLGIDPEDPSTTDTPKRFAKMFIGELTKGLNYDFFPKCTSTPNGNVVVDEDEYGKYIQERVAAWQGQKTEDEVKGMVTTSIRREGLKRTVGAYDEAVIVKHIRTTSLCEHHLQTIDGFTHIAYLPQTKVIGLSKLARVAEFFAARPQIQERMTEQIYHALALILETPDVAVVVDAVHFCMRARGVKQPESWTQTNKMGGRFLEKEGLRREFLDAIRRP